MYPNVLAKIIQLNIGHKYLMKKGGQVYKNKPPLQQDRCCLDWFKSYKLPKTL